MVAFAYGLGLFGTTYLIPVFVQDIAGYTPPRAGNLLFVPGLVLAVAIALAGRLTDRSSPRHVVVTGLACSPLSSLLLALADRVDRVLGARPMAGDRARRVSVMIIPALNVGAVQALPAEYLATPRPRSISCASWAAPVGVNLLAVLLEWRLAAYADVPAPAPRRPFANAFWWLRSRLRLPSSRRYRSGSMYATETQLDATGTQLRRRQGAAEMPMKRQQ